MGVLMTITTVNHYGRVAQAMAQVQQHKPAFGEYSGRMSCTKCGSGLRFTIMSNGLSRGQCSAAGCLRWCQ